MMLQQDTKPKIIRCDSLLSQTLRIASNYTRRMGSSSWCNHRQLLGGRTQTTFVRRAALARTKAFRITLKVADVSLAVLSSVPIKDFNERSTLGDEHLATRGMEIALSCVGAAVL